VLDTYTGQQVQNFIDTALGQASFSNVGPNGPGWYTQAFASQTGGNDTGSSTPGTVGTPDFSTTAPSGTDVGGTVLDTYTGQQVQNFIDTALGQASFSNVGPNGPGWYTQAFASQIGGSNFNPNSNPAVLGLAGTGTGGYGTATAAGATPSLAGGSTPITINITGMTPSNAQTVVSQMTTALRQSSFGKIT
jgi:hypothetical protein